MVLPKYYSCCDMCHYIDTLDNLIDCYSCNERLCNECIYSTDNHECYSNDYTYSGINQYQYYYRSCDYCRYIITQGGYDTIPCFVCIKCDKTLCDHCIDYTKKICKECRKDIDFKEINELIDIFDKKTSINRIDKGKEMVEIECIDLISTFKSLKLNKKTNKNITSNKIVKYRK